MTTFPPWPGNSQLALKGGTGTRHDSAAVCDDGRVIYVWADGNTLKQSHYTSTEDFFLADNAGATAAVTLTLDGVGFLGPRATVWRHPNTGELYLFTSIKTTVPDARNKVWRSPSGNGESAPGVPDWTLHGTIHVNAVSFGGDWHTTTFGVGEPYVTSTGRWILPCTYLKNRDAFQSGVYTSDDEGVTWTNRHIVGYDGLGGVYGYGLGRNIVEVSGTFYFGAYGNIEGPKISVSSNNGTSWTITDVADGVSSADFPIDNAGSTRYRLRWPAGGYGKIQSGSDFLSTAGWSDVLDFTSSWGIEPEHAILQRIDLNNDAFIWNGRLLASTYTPPPDTGAPDTTITSAVIDDTNRTAEFEFVSDEPGTFECKMDSGEWTACTTPNLYENLLPGNHTFYVRAIDESDNVDPTPASHGFFIPGQRRSMSPGSGDNRLGCGVNTAYIVWKGGQIRFCPLTGAESIYWSRVHNDISEAEVIINIQQNDTEDCCACLGDIEPWCHELHIERDGEVVWVGPVIDVIYEYDKVTVKASDVLMWTDFRINEVTIGDGVISKNWSEWAREVLAVAFADENPNVFEYIIVSDADFVGINEFEPYTDTAFQQLIELSQTGIDFTVVGRSIIISPDEIPDRPIVTLRDGMILGNVKLTKQGRAAGTRWYVHYNEDGGLPAISEDVDQQCFGLLERIIPEDEALYNQDVAEETANIYVNATKNVPRIVEIEDDSQLSPEAAWTIEEMIPGVRVDVILSKLCVEAIQSYRLTSMGVLQTPEAEKVSVTLQALNIALGT